MTGPPDLHHLDDWFRWLPTTEPDDLCIWPLPEPQYPDDEAARPPDAVVMREAGRALARIEKRRSRRV